MEITANNKKQITVTLAEISAVKKQHIMENLCYSLREAGAIFGKGEKWAKDRVKDGKLIAVDENAKQSKQGGGLLPSQGIRVTAVSIEAFRKEYEIASDRWAE